MSCELNQTDSNEVAANVSRMMTELGPEVKVRTRDGIRFEVGKSIVYGKDSKGKPKSGKVHGYRESHRHELYVDIAIMAGSPQHQLKCFPASHWKKTKGEE